MCKLDQTMNLNVPLTRNVPHIFWTFHLPPLFLSRSMNHTSPLRLYFKMKSEIIQRKKGSKFTTRSLLESGFLKNFRDLKQFKHKSSKLASMSFHSCSLKMLTVTKRYSWFARSQILSENGKTRANYKILRRGYSIFCNGLSSFERCSFPAHVKCVRVVTATDLLEQRAILTPLFYHKDDRF